MNVHNKPVAISEYIVHTELLRYYRSFIGKLDGIYEKETAAISLGMYQPELDSLVQELFSAFRSPALFPYRLCLDLMIDEAKTKILTGNGSSGLSPIFSFAGAAEDILCSRGDALKDDELFRLRTLVGRIVVALILWEQSCSVHNHESSEVPDWAEEMERVTPIYSGIRVDGDPITFLRRHYGRWIADGRLTQARLRVRDEKLFNAIKYVTRTGEVRLADVVPALTRSSNGRQD